MRAFVTGGGGFLGGALARRLVERGDAVVAFDRRFDLLHLAPPSRVVTARGDITDAAGLAAALREARADAVIHCAAFVSVLSSIESPLDTVRVNIEGAVNLGRRVGRPRGLSPRRPHPGAAEGSARPASRTGGVRVRAAVRHPGRPACLRRREAEPRGSGRVRIAPEGG